MKIIQVILLFLLILLVGCAQKDIETSEEIQPEEQSVADALVGTTWSGTIKGEATYQRTAPGHAYTATVKQVETGEFSFIIYKDRFTYRINGSGIGKVIYTSTGECKAEGSLTTNIKVSGIVDALTGELTLSISDDVDGRAAYSDYTRVCQSELRYKGRPQTTKTSFSAKFDSIYVDELDPVSGASGESSTPWVVSGAFMVHKITINGGSLKESFDFDVDVDPPIITIKQGEIAKATVSVRLVRGNPQPVKLTVTDWSSQNINAWFDKSPLSPGESTILNIKASCNTLPGEYLHTAQGEVGIRSSVDSVNVKVTDYPDCK